MAVDVPTEEEEAKTLAMWLDLARVLWAHVPNEGRHSVSYRVKQSKMGVKPGVPDILIFTPPPKQPTARGCAIELKRARPAKTSLTDAQKYWVEALRTCGWAAHVARGADDAINFLTRQMGYGVRR